MLINDTAWLGLLSAFCFVSASVNYDMIKRVILQTGADTCELLGDACSALLKPTEELVLKAAGRPRRSCVHQKDKGDEMSQAFVSADFLDLSLTRRRVDAWAGLRFLAWL